MLDNIKVLCHSSIKIGKEKIIYIDPFRIDGEYNDADYIFITHDHYDHFSKEDIYKIRKDTTIIIIPECLYDNVIETGFKKENILSVLPDHEYIVGDINFKTLPSYNINKQFHPKEKNYVGYIIYINNISYYIAGDTDITIENQKVKCDVALVPVGGTYTMTGKEAAKLVNIIKPKVAIPTHYDAIIGDKKDAEAFIELLNDNIEGIILIK